MSDQRVDIDPPLFVVAINSAHIETSDLHQHRRRWNIRVGVTVTTFTEFTMSVVSTNKSETRFEFDSGGDSDRVQCGEGEDAEGVAEETPRVDERFGAPEVRKDLHPELRR